MSTRSDLQVIAVDWSGRAKGAAEAIWLARVQGGRLVELENGMSRSELVDRLLDLSRDHPRTITGLDFAFSLPEWYCERRGWGSGPAVWRAMSTEAEHILRDSPDPFWGRPGSSRQTMGEGYRRTDEPPAKSVFQIGGGGAVGTGSLRGMKHLATLAANGFAIWPFEAPGRHTVVEIYPRRLTGPVNKSRHRERRAYLEQHFPDADPLRRERAAGSEDAFDATVSALVMGDHVEQLSALPELASDDPRRIEGAIWAPGRVSGRAGAAGVA